jgi:hypothetical protein
MNLQNPTELLALLGAFAILRKATIGFVVSIHPPAWKNWTPTGRIFMKIDMLEFFENLLRKFKFHYNLKRIKGAVHEDLCTYMYISLSIS